jgi:hypothetical protein
MKKIIYIASPYSHSDKHIRELRYLQVTEYCAKQVATGNIVFSPITYGHILSEHVDMPTTFDFWSNFCLTFLNKCDEMHVIKLEGWENSIGISEEESYCRDNNIPIKYIDYGE